MTNIRKSHKLFQMTQKPSTLDNFGELLCYANRAVLWLNGNFVGGLRYGTVEYGDNELNQFL